MNHPEREGEESLMTDLKDDVSKFECNQCESLGAGCDGHDICPLYDHEDRLREAKYINIDNFILLMLYKSPMKIPSVRFWAMTLLLVSTGIKIRMKNGHFLTKEDCFFEMEDCWQGDCFRLHNRGRLIAYLHQKRENFGWKKLEGDDIELS